MSFATLAVKGSGIGRAIAFDVSFDRFSTTTYRWGTHAGKLDGTNDYSARVVSMGPLARGLGNNRQASPGVFELVLDNTDGLLDTLLARTSYGNLAKLRVLVTAILYDTSTAFVATSSKVLGYFSLMDWPTRSGAAIRLQLSDDTLTQLAGSIDLPTVRDVLNAWPGAFGNDTLATPIGFDVDTPLPLVFGSQAYSEAMPAMIPLDVGSTGPLRVIYLVRCNANEGNGSAADGNVFLEWNLETDGGADPNDRLRAGDLDSSGHLRGYASATRDTQVGNGAAIRLGSSISFNNGAATAARTIWSRGTIDVTKHSTTWTIEYIEIRVLGFLAAQRTAQLGSNIAAVVTTVNAALRVGATPLYSKLESLFSGADINRIRPDVLPPGADATLYNRAGLGLLIPRRLWVQYATGQHACDVLAALADTYCVPPLSRDSASFVTMKAALPLAFVAGRFSGRSGADVRKTFTEICQSADLDVYFKWAGTLAVTGDYYSSISASVAGATLADFPEATLGDVADRLPSVGERGYACNAATIAGGLSRNLVPFVNGGSVASDQIDPGIRLIVQDIPTPWGNSDISFRQVDTKARPRIKFKTDLRGLLSELGDYITLTWSRGTVAVYTADTFQIESLRWVPGTGGGTGDYVEVEALWRASTSSAFPYLLDNQTLAKVADDAGGTKTLSVTDASATVTFTGFNPSSAGVAAGDILKLLDATESPLTFKRFRCLRITGKSATTVTVVDPDNSLDFGAASPTTVSTWEIHHGALTYSALAGASYPNGTGIYGKCCSGSTPFFSDGTTAANPLGNG